MSVLNNELWLCNVQYGITCDGGGDAGGDGDSGGATGSAADGTASESSADGTASGADSSGAAAAAADGNTSGAEGAGATGMGGPSAAATANGAQGASGGQGGDATGNVGHAPNTNPATAAVAAPAAPPPPPTFGAPGSIGNLTPVDLMLADSVLGGRYYRGDNNNYYFRGNGQGNDTQIGTPVSYDTISGLAHQGALAQADQAATARNLNPADFDGLFNTEIDKILGAQPQFSTDFRAPFGPDFGNSVLDQEQARRRADYTQQAGKAFAPDFSKNALPDTFDDNVIDQILNEQFGQTKGLLDNQRARGNLNDIGYNSGMNELNNQKSAGFAKLQGIGGDVLNNYRNTLDQIGNEANTRAGSYTLGQNFNLGDFQNRANTAESGFNNTLEGDIRSQTPQLFDASSLITRGGQAQGAQNNTRALFQALDQNARRRDTQRGLGTEGVF